MGLISIGFICIDIICLIVLGWRLRNKIQHSHLSKEDKVILDLFLSMMLFFILIIFWAIVAVNVFHI